jgi:hypothetical protein
VEGGSRRRPRALDALRHRDFRLLFTGQTISLIGDAAFVTALGWRELRVRPGKLGLVLTCQALAVLTTLLIGGCTCRRISRRKLMIASTSSAAGRRALAVVDAAGTSRTARWWLCDRSSASGTASSTGVRWDGAPVVEQPSIASANS